MYAYMFIAVPLYLVAKAFLTTEPAPVKGVYRLKGKWYYLKYAAFWVLFNLRKLQNKRKKEHSIEGAGYGVKSRNNVDQMEMAQVLPAEHAKAVDAVYFNGGNKDGVYLVAATARRHKNVTQTILFLRIPEIGLLEMTSLPDTYLQASEEMHFAAGGLKIFPLESMKKWKIIFNGKLRLVETSREVSVKFSLDWTAYTKQFDFDTDMNATALCESMAREVWTREYFDSLQLAHQTHYEQFGEITGFVDIEGFEKQKICCQGVRDHSYGNLRDWKDIHRYGIQYVHVEDGTAICLGVICFPITMSRLVIGYVCHPDGKMDTVSWTDFEFYKLGDDGVPPKQFECHFVAGNTNYHMVCTVVEARTFFIGETRCAKVHERFCTFLINEKHGWGISEWDYRNDRFYKEV